MRVVFAAAVVSLVLALATAQTTAVWESGLDTPVSDVPFSKSLAELPEVKAPSKTPAPARFGACSVWYSGSLYVFGGQRGANSVSNDLWRYDTASSSWEFLQGAKEANHPGTQSLPAARSGHACVVQPEANRFLVFAGHKGNKENLADVWAYSFPHNDWQLLSSGQRVASYSSGLLSHPGARTNHAAIFDSDSKSLVIIGGRNSQGLLNDVWSYEVEKGLWHFVSGSQQANAVAIYPQYAQTKSPAAVAAGLAEPKREISIGAREQTMCSNGPSRTVVCYGGKGYAADNIVGMLSDVWTFDLVSRKWKFVHGHDTHKVDVMPLYPVPKDNNTPVGSIGGSSTAKKLQQYFRFRAGEATFSHESLHTDASACPGGRVGGIFGVDLGENIAYVLGGKNSEDELLNDMWAFDLVSKKWSFIRGSTKTSVYGEKGKPTAGAFPPARAFASGAVAPSAAKGGKRFLLFGGQGSNGVFADLWSVELFKSAAKKPSPAPKPQKVEKSSQPQNSEKPQKPQNSEKSLRDAKVNNPFDKDVKPAPEADKPAGSPAVKPFIPPEPPVVTGRVPQTPGCCNAKTPVLVGPYNIPNKETREVHVIGDRANRAPIRLDIDPKTSWYKKYLRDAKKHLQKTGPVIADIKKKHKRLRRAPLVEQN